MMSKHLTYSLVLCVLLSVMAGCSFETKPVHLHATGVQVLDREKNEHFVVDQVRHGDVSRSYASFTWPEAGSAGYHEARWDLFHKGKRILARKGSTYLFTTSPFYTYLILDTTLLTTDTYECVLYLDNKKLATVPLKIVKAPGTAPR